MAFRPSPQPRLHLPFGVRSADRKQVAGPMIIDDTGPRPFTQVYWGVSGAVRFLAPDDQEVWLEPGMVFAYLAGDRHRTRSGPDGAEYAWLTLDGPLAPQVVAAFGLVPPWPRRAGPLPEDLHRRLMAQVVEPDIHAERAATTTAWALLAAAAAGEEPARADDPRLEELRRELADRCTEPDLAIGRLAARLGRDRTALARRFHAVFGLSPKQYVQARRLGRAQDLLTTTGLPVREIAAACGFPDANYFARAFRRATGLSPQQFRGSGGQE